MTTPRVPQGTDPAVVLAHGIRPIHDANGSAVGTWCNWCTRFVGDHDGLCPYDALAQQTARAERLEGALRGHGYHEPMPRCIHGMSRWMGSHCAFDEAALQDAKEET